MGHWESEAERNSQARPARVGLGLGHGAADEHLVMAGVEGGVAQLFAHTVLAAG